MCIRDSVCWCQDPAYRDGQRTQGGVAPFPCSLWCYTFVLRCPILTAHAAARHPHGIRIWAVSCLRTRSRYAAPAPCLMLNSRLVLLGCDHARRDGEESVGAGDRVVRAHDCRHQCSRLLSMRYEMSCAEIVHAAPRKLLQSDTWEKTK
eukprot:3027382-Rhodomonas_salina.1